MAAEGLDLAGWLYLYILLKGNDILMKTYKHILEENRAWAEALFEQLEAKLSVMTIRSRDKIPNNIGPDGFHNSTTPSSWESGFWGALNVLMFAYTGKEDYLLTARSVEAKQDEVFTDFESMHHDVGFMWHILSGALYRLTGDQQSKNRNLLAASTLASRFVLGGNFIRAWNDGNAKSWPGRTVNNWTIIDCMMNLPILYWASEVIGDDRFKRLAMAHADNTIACHIRPDGSVIHIVEHDRETGVTIDTLGGQGYCVGSSWSRGQAWAIYGFTLSYLYTKEERYLDAAKRVANYFIASCADDWLPRTDFRAPVEPVYYDTSAGTCAACGLLELAKILPENEGGMYAHGAVQLLRAICGRFLNLDPATDSLVSHGTQRYPLAELSGKKKGHRMLIYGDFYLIEALTKLLGSEFRVW